MGQTDGRTTDRYMGLRLWLVAASVKMSGFFLSDGDRPLFRTRAVPMAKRLGLKWISAIRI